MTSPHHVNRKKGTAQIPVFTYGTLRHGFFNYEKVLRGLTVAERPGRLIGCVLYDAGGFPFAVRRTGAGDSVVVGELMTIRPDRYVDVLRQLDELEGCDPEDPGSLFRRVMVNVSSDNGSVRAWLYEAGDTVEQDFTPDDRIHCGDWAFHQRGEQDMPLEAN